MAGASIGASTGASASAGTSGAGATVASRVEVAAVRLATAAATASVTIAGWLWIAAFSSVIAVATALSRAARASSVVASSSCVIIIGFVLAGEIPSRRLSTVVSLSIDNCGQGGFAGKEDVDVRYRYGRKEFIRAIKPLRAGIKSSGVGTVSI